MLEDSVAKIASDVPDSSSASLEPGSDTTLKSTPSSLAVSSPQ